MSAGNDSCFSARQICAARFALLNPTGSPDAGANNGYVTNLVSLVTSPQISEGDKFIQKDGCGDICARFLDCDKVEGVDATVNICTLDPLLVALVTGGQTFTDVATDDVVGMKLPSVADGCPQPICLEWWTYAQDGSQQATPAVAPNGAYWHHVIPYLTFTIGGETFENGIPIRPLVGKGSENPNITINGPFNDWPASVALTDGIDSPYGYWLEGSIPTVACNYVEVTSAAS